MTIKFVNKYQTIGKTLYEPESKLPSMTDESFKQECDIEFIISNFVQRGIEPPQHPIDYGNQITSEVFMNSMQLVAECKTAFEELPALEKERFNNSVTNFLDFISNPDNLKESYEKGYINPDSVNIADIYPDRFYGDSTTVTDTAVSQGSSTGSNTVVEPASAGAENPTQTTN